MQHMHVVYIAFGTQDTPTMTSCSGHNTVCSVNFTSDDASMSLIGPCDLAD